jgi:hypothetical protein
VKTVSPFWLIPILLLMFWAGVRALEQACLYAPDRRLTLHPGTYGLPYESVRIETEDGRRLHGWFIADSTAPHRPAVLVFHGNAGNVSTRVEKARLLAARGFDVLLFDYRGYGESEGAPDERGLYRDGLAAARWLEARGVPASRTVYYGESLGCAVALETALARPPRALVLDSAFTSAPAMARLIFPRVPLHRLIRSRYDNLSKILRLKVPLLVVHSPEDEMIPFSMGERLYDAAPGRKRLLRTGGTHNEGFLTFPGWADGVSRFMREHLEVR